MALKVLVIDDEEDYRIIIQDVLQGAGYEVTLARDGEEGLRVAKEATFDIVLVDWMMPRMDGEKFSRALRAEPKLKAVPVIMLTVKQTADEELEALHFGVDDFVVKPFKSPELLARVKAAMRRVQSRPA